MSEPSFSESLRNWREYEGSFGEKVRLTLRNNFRKLRTRSNCCGNPGEPGC